MFNLFRNPICETKERMLTELFYYHYIVWDDGNINQFRMSCNSVW